MDLSRAYGYLPHDTNVAKLEAYGLAKESLQLINDYLSYRNQRTKIGSAYSDWANAFSELRKFADDNTLYSHGSNLPLILSNLEHDMRNLLHWFKINSPGKPRRVSVDDT